MFIRVSLPAKMTFPAGPLKGELQHSATEKKLWQFESARRLLLQYLDNPMTDQMKRKHIEELIGTIDAAIPVAQEKLKEFEELARSNNDLGLHDVPALPQRLIAGRLRLGWSQAELARRIGVSRQNVTKYEATIYAGVAFSRMCQIAALLQESLEDDKEKVKG